MIPFAMFVRLLTKPWLIKILSKETRMNFISELKQFIEYDFDTQLREFVDNLRVAIRETNFARRFFPELLSIEDPEDLIDLRITMNYPENLFEEFKGDIFCVLKTRGTTEGVPKRIFVPLTRKSIEVMVRGALLICAIANHNSEKMLFDRILIFSEPDSSIKYYSNFLRFIARKAVVCVGGLEQLERTLRKSGNKYDLVLADIYTMTEILRKYVYKYADKFDENVILSTRFSISSEDIHRFAEEARNSSGLNLRILNLYASTETMIMAMAMYFDDSNPYSSPFGWLKPIYLTTASVGVQMTDTSLTIPTKVEDFIHKMAGYKEYLVAATTATAFSLPNYLLNDLVANRGTHISVIGRRIVYIGNICELGELGELFTGISIGSRGIQLKQDFAEFVAKVIDTENFIVLIIPCMSGIIMQVISERIPPDPRDRLISLIKGDSRYSHIADYIESGRIILEFEERANFKDIQRRIYKRCPLIYKIFVVGEPI